MFIHLDVTECETTAVDLNTGIRNISAMEWWLGIKECKISATAL